MCIISILHVVSFHISKSLLTESCNIVIHMEYCLKPSRMLLDTGDKKMDTFGTGYGLSVVAEILGSK